MTVTTLQTILITALIATWLVFSIVFLISSIQSFFNDRKREEESAARDLKYHEERMQREKEQAEHEREYHEKRMKSLE